VLDVGGLELEEPEEGGWVHCGRGPRRCGRGIGEKAPARGGEAGRRRVREAVCERRFGEEARPWRERSGGGCRGRGPWNGS